MTVRAHRWDAAARVHAPVTQQGITRTTGRTMLGTTTAFPDYSYYTTTELLNAYAAGAARLRQSLDGLTEDELRAHPRGPDKWSIQEIVLHTADSEMQGAYRFRKVFCEPGALLPLIDQDVWSRTLDYNGQPASVRERALTLIGIVRDQVIHVLRDASPEDWDKSGTHPEFGEVTLRNLLELYADHIERHVEQVLSSRARLGRPLSIDSMLPRRLY
jgi:hypothetical protein